jgi:orotate phosphoribosyltransferase-like protein
MAKEKVKHLTGVFASMFAHAGHITKEEAKEISGMADHEFEKAYDKASVIADKVVESGDSKMEKFMDHLAREVEKDITGFGEKIF